MVENRNMATPSSELEAVQTRLRSHLHQIARERDIYFNAVAHRSVRQYVKEQLEQWGEVKTHEFVAEEGTTQPEGVNLILDLLGERDKPPVLIGAHYDGVPGSPGADDNASGVAVLLELARAIAQNPTPVPVRLVAFDLEEYGLLGSRAYATDLRQQAEVIRFMLSLEMLGYCDPTPGSQNYPSGLKFWYPNHGDFVALVGNVFTILEMLHLSHSFRKSGVPCQWLPAGVRGKIVPATRLSDHSPFWDVGYKALMVTDTAFLRNPNYHQASDRTETLDFDFMSRICKGLEHSIRRLT